MDMFNLLLHDLSEASFISSHLYHVTLLRQQTERFCTTIQLSRPPKSWSGINVLCLK